jgi:hypothetical protein
MFGFMVFQQYFSYIVAVSFIGGGNWRTRRKPLTGRHGHDRMVAGFTATYAISVYHH